MSLAWYFVFALTVVSASKPFVRPSTKDKTRAEILEKLAVVENEIRQIGGDDDDDEDELGNEDHDGHFSNMTQAAASLWECENHGTGDAIKACDGHVCQARTGLTIPNGFSLRHAWSKGYLSASVPCTRDEPAPTWGLGSNLRTAIPMGQFVCTCPGNDCRKITVSNCNNIIAPFNVHYSQASCATYPTAQMCITRAANCATYPYQNGVFRDRFHLGCGYFMSLGGWQQCHNKCNEHGQSAHRAACRNGCDYMKCDAVGLKNQGCDMTSPQCPDMGGWNSPACTEAQCASWCGGHPKPWSTKCNFNKCNGCSDCAAGNHQCASWCAGHPKPWSTKCAFNQCNGCSDHCS